MNWEHLNITEEEFENNTNLQINIVDLDSDELLQMCLDEKGIEITDDISKADYTLENPSSADGFDLFYFGDTNYQYDFYENVFVNEDSAIQSVMEFIYEEDNFVLYMDLDKSLLSDDEDLVFDLAESLGLIMRDDVAEFGELDNPNYDEWVWVKDYNDREVELDLLDEGEKARDKYTEEDYTRGGFNPHTEIDKAVDNAVDRIMEGNIDSDKE